MENSEWGVQALLIYALTYEVLGSKKCLDNHGINATVFAAPHGDEARNATIINEIAKYYDLAVNGSAHLTFLHCNGYTSNSSQTDCRTHFNNGMLTFTNRYSIGEWSHNTIDKTYSHNNTKIFDIFVNEVSNQEKYNNVNGTIAAIPIIAYHNIDNNKTRSSTDVNLFAQDMKYLYDNGFNVLTVNDLGYNAKNNVLYIKHFSKTALKVS